eukprot:scaffold4494_cov161-Amphora_coffeaeformis.AAC.12
MPTLSHNVPLTLAYTAFVFAGRSVWSQSVLSTFVFLIKEEDYRAVGFITAVMGLAQLVTSFPTGYLADRHRRDLLLRVASVVGFLAMASTLFAIHQSHYVALVIALAVWGCYWGISNTAMSAIFADSIPIGERSKYFTQRSLLMNIGFAVGPMVSLIMFAVLGDTWNVRDCAIVLAVGQAICLPAVVLLFFLSDDYVLPHETQNDEIDEETNNGTEENQATIPIGDAPRENDVGQNASSDSILCCLTKDRRIAIFVATADLISGLASGMSIRYFPIFFVDSLKMGPVLVQILYAVSPLCLACCMKVAQRLSKTFGRCRIAVTFKWTGILLMYAMVVVYKTGQPRWLVCAIYVLRTAFMNSTGALTRSVLMDSVPTKERARWAALESLNMFSWSGSAALGGVLVGYTGLVPLFCITACLQFLATFPLTFLATHETLEGHQVQEQRNLSMHFRGDNGRETNASLSSIHEPLLVNSNPLQAEKSDDDDS